MLSKFSRGPKKQTNSPFPHSATPFTKEIVPNKMNNANQVATSTSPFWNQTNFPECSEGPVVNVEFICILQITKDYGIDLVNQHGGLYDW